MVCGGKREAGEVRKRGATVGLQDEGAAGGNGGRHLVGHEVDPVRIHGRVKAGEGRGGRTDCTYGKLKGVIMEMRPTGKRRTRPVKPGFLRARSRGVSGGERVRSRRKW